MKSPALISAVLLTAVLGGCVVAPPIVGSGYYGAPPGVAYLAPTYATPGPGYAWGYHGRYGWGWRHPRYGWHRGWQ